MNNTPKVKDEIEIDLMELIRALMSRWMVVVAAAVIGVLIGLQIVPAARDYSYTATATLIIQAPKSKEQEISQITESQKLAAAGSVFIRSNRVMSEVVGYLGGTMTIDDLKQCLKVTSVEGSQLIQLTVTDADREMTEKIINTVIQVATPVLKDMLAVASAEQFGQIVITEQKPDPVSSTKNGVMGGILAAACAVVAVLVLELFHTGLKSKEDLESQLGLPVLGVLPCDISAKKETDRYLKKAKEV